MDAWVHLTRLCGCNYRVPTRRKGASIYVADPQCKGRTYRLSAADFDAGKPEYRKPWCIEPFIAEAAKRCAEERDWQA